MNEYQTKLIRTLTDLVKDLDGDWCGFSGHRANELIVNLLNEKGIKTERGKEWTLKRWRECRLSMAINEKTGKRAKTVREVGEILENAGLDEEMAFCRSKIDGFQQ